MEPSGRVPQISADWTVGVEFDNAIGEGDGSLNGRRYFIAKDCFAKFLALDAIALVDQHVGRPEPGTMISVMSAASRPGQLISIQRVSTVHVQHCFLNAPHRRPGPEIPLLAVNTRLHCQCPNCGPCAHVIKPPRTQRLARPTKNATHMCQFSTYTCCGMQSQEETMCTYQGNKVMDSSQPETLPGNSWFAGSGYLTSLQAQQSKSMPQDEYKLLYGSGARPDEDPLGRHMMRRLSRTSSNRSYNKHQQTRNLEIDNNNNILSTTTTIDYSNSIDIDSSGAIDNLLQENNNIDYISQQLQSITNLDCEQSSSPSASPGFHCDAQLIDESPTNSPLVNALTEQTNNSVDMSPQILGAADPIDPALEADLERLSEARYGRRPERHRESGPRRRPRSGQHRRPSYLLDSCSSTDAFSHSKSPITQHQKQNHSSGHVLKTLCSFLSCLSLNPVSQKQQHHFDTSPCDTSQQQLEQHERLMLMINHPNQEEPNEQASGRMVKEAAEKQNSHIHQPHHIASGSVAGSSDTGQGSPSTPTMSPLHDEQNNPDSIDVDCNNNFTPSDQYCCFNSSSVHQQQDDLMAINHDSANEDRSINMNRNMIMNQRQSSSSDCGFSSGASQNYSPLKEFNNQCELLSKNDNPPSSESLSSGAESSALLAEQKICLQIAQKLISSECFNSSELQALRTRALQDKDENENHYHGGQTSGLTSQQKLIAGLIKSLLLSPPRDQGEHRLGEQSHHDKDHRYGLSSRVKRSSTRRRHKRSSNQAQTRRLSFRRSHTSNSNRSPLAHCDVARLLSWGGHPDSAAGLHEQESTKAN